MKAHNCAIANSVSAHKNCFEKQIVEHTTLYTYEKATELPLLNSESIEDDINSVRAHNNFVENKIVHHYKQNTKKKHQNLLNTKMTKVKQKLSMRY